MTMKPRSRRFYRTGTVALFIAVGLLIFAVLWAKSGGTIPGVTGYGYKFDATFTNIANLAPAGDVEMAGVPIGLVQSVHVEGDKVKVDMVLHRNAPLHQGATVQIQEKTLVGETYVALTDGNGKALPSGTAIPISADKNYTSLNTLFDSFNTKARTAASKLVDELNTSTTGDGADLGQLLSALSNVGSQGGTVFDVLSSQTSDLKALVRQTATLLGVLDEGQGQIADLSDAAEEVTQETADESTQLSAAVQELPGLITTAHTASQSIVTLSDALSPIASNLRTAAPSLNTALETLPSTTGSLRTLMPVLNKVLVAAPATLKPLPSAATDVTKLVTPAADLLSNLDPMVAYLEPYRKDIAAFFSNFGAVTDHYDSLAATAPFQLTVLPETEVGYSNVNAYPKAGASQTDGTATFTGKYPHVKRENS